MIQITAPINQSVVLTVHNPSGQSGQMPSDTLILKDGMTGSVPPVSVTDLTIAGLYNFTFTPVATGVYTIFAFGDIVARVEVVSRTLQSYLQNLEDESIGSWIWDKTAGTLNMLRQDGSALASFNVVDTLTTASRERTQ